MGIAGMSLPQELAPLVEHWDLNEIARFAPIRHLEVLLHDCERSYLNSDFKDAGQKLTWVHQLASNTAKPSTVALTSIVPLPTDEIHSAERREVVALTANKLLSQLRLGFDFFGYPRNFVPLVDLKYYEQTLDALFGVAETVEKRFEDFWRGRKDVDAYKGLLNAAALTIEATIRSQEQKGVQLGESANQLLSDIKTLSEKASGLEVLLQEADRDFKDALSRKSPGCQLSDMLAFVRAVVIMVAAIYTGGAAIAVGIAGFVESGVSITEDIQKRNKNAPVTDEAIAKYRIDHLEMVGEGVGKLEEAYAKFRELLKNKEEHSVKIAVDEQNFEAQLKPYLDLPEAQKYRDLMRSFVDICKTRNDKIVEFTANTLEQADIKVRNQQRLLDATVFKDRLSTATAQSLDYEAIKSDLRVALDDCKHSLIRILYASHRALEYWSLDFQSLSFKDETIAQLRATFGQWKTRVLDAVQERNRDPQKFTNVVIELDRATMPNVFDRFVSVGVLDFNLSIDQGDFQKLDAAVTVSRVHVEIPGAETNDRTYKFTLTHNGRGTFRTTKGKIVDFIHRPRATTEVYQLAKDGSVNPQGPSQIGLLGAEDGKYAYLSPFAHWTLEMPENQNHGRSLKTVTKVKLTFDGYSMPRST